MKRIRVDELNGKTRFFGVRITSLSVEEWNASARFLV